MAAEYSGMDMPRRIWPPVFVDDFRYRGSNFLPGAQTIPDEWSVISGAFSTANERQLICTSPGLLRYVGTPLNLLLTGLTYPNFLWAVRLYGQEDLDFSLRVRENPISNTYISIRIKFTANEVILTNKQTSITSSFIGDYTLRTNPIDYYNIELWTLNEEDYWVTINGRPIFPIQDVPVVAGHEGDYGFALEVHNIPSAGGKFAKFAVHEIVPFSDPTPNNDSSNLPRIFRELMKESIENPSVRNWNSFLKARKLWENHRGFGQNNQFWEINGLPVREPLPEEFLYNTTYDIDESVTEYTDADIEYIDEYVYNDTNEYTVDNEYIDESVLPLVVDQSVFVAKNCLKPFVLASSPLGDPTDNLTYTLISSPANGTLYVQDPDNFNQYTAYSGTLGLNMFYMPTTGYTGVDSISFQATDGWFDSVIATITFNVQAPSSYTYPIGIPSAPFGIAETVESEYGSDSYYTHYVDPTHPSATDSGNPNGSTTTPRMSIPTDPAAGSVVVIAAGTFPSLLAITANGTAEQPIFYRGLNQLSKPLFTNKIAFESDATYIIMENIALDRGYSSSAVNITDGHHICVRHSDFADAQGGLLVYDTVSNIVLYNNHIHDFGDLNIDSDIDDNGIQIGGGEDIWVLDNVVTRIVGSGIVLNPGFGEPNSTIQNVYIGRNVVHGVRQSGLYSKQSLNCVFSQNLAFSIIGTSWAQSTGFGYQYGPDNVWFIFNRAFNCEYGLGSGSNSVDFPGQNQYIIGNLFHHIRPWDGSGSSSSAYHSSAIYLLGGIDRHVYNNTIYDAVAGINCPDSGSISYYLNNNIISNITSVSANHIYILDEGGGTTFEIRNNLFESSGAVKIRYQNTTMTQSQFESAFPANASGNETGDPLFVGPYHGDFRLEAGSPAINSGTSLSSILTAYNATFGVSIDVDWDGLARIGTIDIGAFEKQ